MLNKMLSERRRKMKNLIGYEAIDFKRSNSDAVLCKYADPTEGAREDISVEEAEDVVDEDPSLIYVRPEIRIISGEGEIGTVERYSGKRSERAIKLRLSRERCNGDRWARAVQYSHENEHGKVGIDLETGEYCTFPNIEE
jgi:hypothetical protein